MTSIYWTERAQNDLAAIHAFVLEDSFYYADVVVRKILATVDRLRDFPESGRLVPEFDDATLREVIVAPYRIAYRIIKKGEIHVLAVHHSARGAHRRL